MIDTFKEFAPVLTAFTGLLIAFMSGFFFKKNKQTEYSMKLAELAIEKVYNQVLVTIEETPGHTEGYKGLTFEEVQNIKSIFSNQRHLVDDMLWNMIWRFEEEYKNREEYNRLSAGYRGTSLSPVQIDKYYDQDGKFLERLIFVRRKHLKNIGFSTHFKPSIFDKVMMLFMKYQESFRKYRIQKDKKRMYKRVNKKSR